MSPFEGSQSVAQAHIADGDVQDSSHVVSPCHSSTMGSTEALNGDSADCRCVQWAEGRQQQCIRCREWPTHAACPR